MIKKLLIGLLVVLFLASCGGSGGGNGGGSAAVIYDPVGVWTVTLVPNLDKCEDKWDCYENCQERIDIATIEKSGDKFTIVFYNESEGDTDSYELTVNGNTYSVSDSYSDSEVTWEWNATINLSSDNTFTGAEIGLYSLNIDESKYCKWAYNLTGVKQTN